MSPSQWTILFALSAAFIFVLYMMGRVIYDSRKFAQVTVTYGFAGKVGDTIPLPCPAGHIIRIYRAVYRCGDLNPNNTIALANADPDAGHAIDFTTAMGKAVNGQGSTTYTIPAPNPAPTYPCTTMYLSGSYDCVPVT